MKGRSRKVPLRLHPAVVKHLSWEASLSPRHRTWDVLLERVEVGLQLLTSGHDRFWWTVPERAVEYKVMMPDAMLGAVSEICSRTGRLPEHIIGMFAAAPCCQPPWVSEALDCVGEEAPVHPAVPLIDSPDHFPWHPTMELFSFTELLEMNGNDDAIQLAFSALAREILSTGMCGSEPAEPTLMTFAQALLDEREWGEGEGH